MKRAFLFFVALSIASVGAARAGSPTRITVLEKSRLTIYGTSTLHDFSIEANRIRGVIEAEPRGEGISILAAEIEIPVRVLDSGNSSMNENMWRALKETEYPVITYRLSSATIESATKEKVVFKTVGVLTVAGTSREIEMVVTATLERNGSIRLEGTKELRMTDFGVTPPSMMLGTIKTGNAVTVQFQVLTEPFLQVSR